jgi:prolyl-tRNA synthetase
MKLKNSFFYTIREDIKNEDSTSGNLLVRSGMIKKESTGTYMYMPMGLKVQRNIENIIREEMDKTGCGEVLMPSLIHQEVYEASGRIESFGNSVFKLTDRFNKPYILGPTHEELFAIAAKQKVKSYKDLPFSLYQFQNKFRDEPRPRYGLIRVREFIMKDAYTFDKDIESLDESYNKIYNAYKNIFDRLGVNYRIVKSDTGVMGGMLSEEFQAITDIGEDVVIYCERCEFASNIDIAEVVPQDNNTEEEVQELEELHTPNCKTIKDLTELLNIDESKLIKTMIYKIDGDLYACLVPGNRETNETKILKLVEGTEIELPETSEIELNSNAVVGFAGPIDLDIKIIVDESLLNSKNMVVGANKKDYHYKNANINRDFEYDCIGDITNIKESDPCPLCGAELHFTKGIEIGNTFKLGTKYSEALNLKYLDSDNKLQPVVMGSYGIGLGRTLAAIVEQNNDENGIIWPASIAPYKVAIVLINDSDQSQKELAEKLYTELNNKKIETVLDDRNERPGIKFKDADLIGYPIRIVVGKKAAEGIVELKERTKDEVKEINSDNVLEEIAKILN